MNKNDMIWRTSLGVDIDGADAFLSDPSSVASWLDRFSHQFLSYVTFGQLDAIVPPKYSRRRLIDRLVDRHFSQWSVSKENSSIRRLYRVYLFMRGKRRRALELADAVVMRGKGLTVKGGYVDDDEFRLALGLHVSARSPHHLKPYMLLDRAQRVRFRAYRIDEQGHVEKEMNGIAKLRSMSREQLDGALNRFYGEPDRIRLVGDVSLGGIVPPSEAAYLLFFLKRGSTESIQSYDGVCHIVRGDWIILKYSADGRAVDVHPAADVEGVRLAEVLMREATDRVVVYKDLSQ